MKLLKKLNQQIRLFIANFLGLDIKFMQKNIFRNQETPDSQNILQMMNSNGVLHIGAHRGSERYFYDFLGKNVIWVEANPFIFKELKKNLMEFKYQSCFKALLDFFLASNDNASSSIFDFSENFKNNKIYFQNKKRNIEMKNKIKLTTNTLDNLILENNINIKSFDHWVVDVQGAELDVLKGSEESLKYCNSMVIEVSTDKFYEKGTLFSEIELHLNNNNFYVFKKPSRNHEDVLFLRKNNN